MRLTLVTAIALTYYFASVSLTNAVAIPPASSNTLLNSDSLQARTFGNFPVPVPVDNGLVLRAGESVDGQNSQPKNDGLFSKLLDAFESYRARHRQLKYKKRLAVLGAELDDDLSIPAKRLPNNVWENKILEYMKLMDLEYNALTLDERRTSKQKISVVVYLDLLDMLITPLHGKPVRSQVVAMKAAEIRPWWEKECKSQQQPKPKQT
ncbi:hypothetical protein H0H93_011933 [Arthromyces matolae]|nr:hypothetical protein H0H93_011933 [Arthromyces matolae]